jgi:hypothetical protein
MLNSLKVQINSIKEFPSEIIIVQRVPKKSFALPDALPLAVVIKVPCSLFLIIYQEKK